MYIRKQCLDAYEGVPKIAVSRVIIPLLPEKSRYMYASNNQQCYKFMNLVLMKNMSSKIE